MLQAIIMASLRDWLKIERAFTPLVGDAGGGEKVEASLGVKLVGRDAKGEDQDLATSFFNNDFTSARFSVLSRIIAQFGKFPNQNF